MSLLKNMKSKLKCYFCKADKKLYDKYYRNTEGVYIKCPTVFDTCTNPKCPYYVINERTINQKQRILNDVFYYTNHVDNKDI
jgi:hypothetical protein